MKRVMIDTCAWIDFFKSKNGRLGDQVAALIETNQAAITGVVIAELLQGVKQEKESQRLRLLFRSIHYLPTEDSDWFTAGILAQQLRAKGLTLPLTDVLIAVIAQRHAITVLTLDKHFQHLPVEHFCDG
ncbi:type II toxin-antitoxin system VapC family toxin [Methylomonas rivi]|uniref:Ribonuclease VapC n=1 Tax=Methylomonas rivi TaxID=2952226 RepID=A0ABT1U4F0_9GAMM|nr:PIN domain-containing protein [Methylomonas sp. WSC-6]MCQ8128433.1 PIN domain-containing protein [Methylomonas sp. WSC-6]